MVALALILVVIGDAVFTRTETDKNKPFKLFTGLAFAEKTSEAPNQSLHLATDWGMYRATFCTNRIPHNRPREVLLVL